MQFSSYKRDTGERLAAIETHVDNIYKVLSDIKENHLAHLQTSIMNIEQLVIGRPTWLSSVIITILTAILSALLGAYFMGR